MRQPLSRRVILPIAAALAGAILATPASAKTFASGGGWTVVKDVAAGHCTAERGRAETRQRYVLTASWRSSAHLAGGAEAAGGEVATLAGGALDGARAEAAEMGGGGLAVTLGGAAALRRTLMEGGLRLTGAGGAVHEAPAPEGLVALGMLMDCAEFLAH